ncbi:hypothetical protein ACP4OV_010515 [Aristida adscensionis]
MNPAAMWSPLQTLAPHHELRCHRRLHGPWPRPPLLLLRPRPAHPLQPCALPPPPLPRARAVRHGSRAVEAPSPEHACGLVPARSSVERRSMVPRKAAGARARSPEQIRDGDDDDSMAAFPGRRDDDDGHGKPGRRVAPRRSWSRVEGRQRAPATTTAASNPSSA